jgi:hypothetical protein
MKASRARTSAPRAWIVSALAALVFTAGASAAERVEAAAFPLADTSVVGASAVLTEDVLGAQAEAARYSEADPSGRYVYLIRFAEPGLLERFRQFRGASEPFDPESGIVRQATPELQGQQRAHVQNIDSTIGRSVEVTHHYLATHSGIAARLTPAEAAAVQGMPGVVDVQREQVFELDTYRGPEFIGAGAIWSGTATPGNLEHLGAGMVAAVLDTGADVNSPSFANDAMCGHGVGPIPNKLLSVQDCSSTNGSGMCNGPNPADDNSHGSHTAGTVAGNFIDATAVPPPALPGAFTQMSGVAPCASLRIYRVCPDSCPGADIQAGMNSILLHGDVDVMNFSISGGSSPWNDNDRRKLDLVDAGIFVAASAGNTSATVTNPVGQVNHRGPWVMSVAASTRDTDTNGGSAQGDVLANFSLRGPTPAPLADLQKPDITGPGVSIYAATVGYALSVSGPAPVPPNLTGIAMDIGSQSPVGSPLSNHPIAFDPAQTISPPVGGPPAPGGTDGCSPPVGPGFAPGTFTGKVALIQRGSCNFSEKINNAAAAGASMVVIWNNQPAPISMDTTGQANIPAFSISENNGIALRNFIASNPTATINYLAALDSQFGFISGTSMSSPHIAGAAVLVRQARPEWSPSEVKSAMQMTAVKAGFQENGTSPWNWDDVGSGRVDLNSAALAGFVMDETFANYLAANPGTGGNVKTLNLPALRNLDCAPSCTFTRTVKNALSVPSSWSTSSSFSNGNFNVAVSPSTFNFTGAAGQTQTLTVTVTPVGNNSGTIRFGELVFTEAGGLSPPLHWTLAMRGTQLGDPQAQITPDSFDLLVAQDGSTSTTLSIANVAAGSANLTYTIAEAQPSSVVVLGEKPVAGEEQPLGDGQSVPVNLQFDGGIATLIGVGNQQWLWFNRFSPTALQLPFTLNQVQVGFAPGNGNVVAGHLFDVYVWTDADRDPTNGATLVASVTGQTITAGVNFKTVNIPGGVSIGADAGDVLIGVVNRSTFTPPQTSYSPAVADTPGNSQERSWAAFNFPGGNAANPPVITDAATLSLIDGLLPGRNWTIRGFGIGGSACLAPSDVSWLAVTPASGSVAAGTSANVQVEVNMTGLAIGTYEARLCIETNDPALPIAVVPLTVEVVDAGDLPVMEVAPAAMDFTVTAGDTDSDTLTISNAGTGVNLNWNIETAELAAIQGSNIVRFDNVNFTFPANATGGSVQWHTGDTCNCDTAPYHLNVWTSGGNIAFFWPSTGQPNRGAVAAGGAYSVLEPGAVIGPASAFSSSAGTANWRQAAGVTGYLGFRFDHPGGGGVTAGIKYGYALMSTTGTTGNPATIIGWAYNTAGDPITIPNDTSACDDPNAVSWLSVSPTSGSTAAGGSSPVNVQVNATSLVAGDYEALLCVSSNDPSNSLVEVPVSLTVEAAPLPPTIGVTPASLQVTVEPGGADSRNLSIDNSGTSDLVWTIAEENTTQYQYGRPGAGVLQSPQGGSRDSGIAPSGDVTHTVGPAPQGGAIGVSFNEGFDDITTLPGAGWAMQNNSSPVGSTGWFQGGAGSTFPGHQGGQTSYIGANFNNTTGANTISNWLLTPHITLQNGTELRFWTRVPTGSSFPDRLQVRLSTAGASTDVGTSSTDVGDFTNMVVEINPGLAAGGYPDVWTEFVVTVSGLGAPTSGRFAFRYFVTNGGPSGANSDFIGIDTFSITQPTVGPGACDSTSDMPWVSVNPLGGTTAPGASSSVNVAFDSSGLADGVYTGNLCVSSNDPATPLVVVPLTLTVEEAMAPPTIEVSTAPIDFALAPGGSTSTGRTIGNSGEADLLWTIDEAELDRVGYVYGRPGAGTHVSPQGGSRDSGIVPSGNVTHAVEPAPQGGAIGVSFNEGFDDITTLPGAGWAMQNNSSPVGLTGWFQGGAGSTFPGHQGGQTSYIGANFNNTTGTNTISNWLMTPHITLQNGTELRFWTRVPTGSSFPDRLQVRLSTAGASTDVGTSSTDVGDFTNMVVEINPGLVVGGYPDVWTEFVVTVSGLGAPTSGRFAFRYFVTNGGPNGANSDFIGIDTFSITQPVAAGCDGPTDLPWLNVTPAAGTTAGGAQSTVTVQANATGLVPGLYEGQLCVNSNDPVTPRVTVPVSLTVAQASQTIDFGPLADRTIDQSPFNVSATATSGLPVSFSSLTAAVCTVSGTQVSLHAAGTCTIRASQAGDATWAAAPNVDQSFEVTLLTQTIDFAPLADRLVTDSPFTVDATATSGLAVEFTSLTNAVCTVNGDEVTLIDAGTCTIRASQDGNVNYEPAPNVDRSFEVIDPVITIEPPTVPNAVIDEPYSVTFSASGDGSTGSFTFSVTGDLPAGLTLDADGELSGTPTEIGEFDFTITATDETPAPIGPLSGSRGYTLIVSETIIFMDGFEPLPVPDGDDATE